MNCFVPAFVVIVSVHTSVAVAGGVGPLYVTVTGSASHSFNVTAMAGGIAGPNTKFAHPGCAGFVAIPVTVSGAVPLLMICIVCGADGVSLGGTGGMAAGLPGLNVAVNVLNAIGFVLNTGTAAGLTVRPFGDVSVHPVVALV